MARRKFEGERTATLVRGYAMEGYTNEEIARKLGVSRKTIQEWANRYSDIGDALKQGKVQVDFEVEQALLTKALSGDVTACIFWLKNRRPRQWRDRPHDDSDEAIGQKVDDLLRRANDVARDLKRVQ